MGSRLDVGLGTWMGRPMRTFGALDFDGSARVVVVIRTSEGRRYEAAVHGGDTCAPVASQRLVGHRSLLL